MHNDYEVGSLLWIERNQANAIRALLEAVLDGTYTIEQARQELHTLDTDTL
jgi:hypothetical protein